MRNDWNKVKKVDELLADRNPHTIDEREIHRAIPYFTRQKKGFVDVLNNAGPSAVWDFIKNAPALGLMHLKKEFRDG